MNTVDEIPNQKLKAEFDRLEGEISTVAYHFRGCLADEVCRETWVEKYHAIFKHMYELGWRERLIDEDQLPWNLMPKTYREMYPDPGLASLYTDQDYHTPREIEYKPLGTRHPIFIDSLFAWLIRRFK